MPITIALDMTAAPKVKITISTPDGSAMTAAVLYRVVGTTRTPTRVQPSTGTASQFIEDYAADWDTATGYEAVISYAGGASTATLDSSTVTITSAIAWAIHPTTPALSIPIDSGSFLSMGLASLGDIMWASNRTLHTVLDNPYPIPVSTGDRAAAAGQMTISTTTAAEQYALRSLLNDHTPILIRVPGAWGWDWEDGYYDIGDVSAGRPNPFGPDHSRTFTLPYQRVQAPAGGQQSTWDYPKLVAAFADYPSMRAAYVDYASLTGDERR